MSSLSCNICFKRPDGIAYRTTCNHYFCPACAHNTFVDSNVCPLCSTLLGKDEVIEMNVGMGYDNSVGHEVMSGFGLFSKVLASHRLDSVVTNLNDSHNTMSMCNQFVIKQLLTSIDIVESNNTVLSDKLESEQQEFTKLARNYRQEIEDKEVLLSECQSEIDLLKARVIELKEAYKEKDRKCNAWEVAYNSIREQLNTGTSSAKSKSSKHTQPSSTQPAPLASSSNSKNSSSGSDSHNRQYGMDSERVTTKYHRPMDKSTHSNRFSSKHTSIKRANVDDHYANRHHDLLMAQKKASMERLEETQASWKSYSEAALYRHQSSVHRGHSSNATQQSFSSTSAPEGSSGYDGFLRSRSNQKTTASRWFHTT